MMAFTTVHANNYRSTVTSHNAIYLQVWVHTINNVFGDIRFHFQTFPQRDRMTETIWDTYYVYALTNVSRARGHFLLIT